MGNATGLNGHFPNRISLSLSCSHTQIFAFVGILMDSVIFSAEFPPAQFTPGPDRQLWVGVWPFLLFYTQMWWSRNELCQPRAESLGGLTYFLDFQGKFERGFSKDLSQVVKEVRKYGRKYGKSIILLPASRAGLFMANFSNHIPR